MATALDVARYLVRLASGEPDQPWLTHLHLQKLLYYSQGWSLAARGRPLVSDRFEAWAHGPVVPRLYSKLASVGSCPVTEALIGEPDGLTPGEKALIETVWAEYKRYSASELYRKTHSEPPWNEARGNLPEGVSSDAEITTESMAKYFREVVRPRVPPGFDLAGEYDDEEDGPTVPLEEALRRRRERDGLPS